MRLARLLFLAAVLLSTALAAAADTKDAGNTPMPPDSPFAQPSPLPFEFPQFDRIRDADYAPAYEAGMREQLKEVAAIAHNPQPATFENTIVALERSGRLLDRVETVFSNLNSCNTDAEMQKVDIAIAPKLAAHNDAIFLDAALWARIDALYGKRASLKLDPESLQLLTRYYTHFVRAGAKLSAGDQQRLRAINEQLSTLTTRFRQNVLKATADGAVVVDKVSDLDGLTPVQIGAAAQAAADRGLKDKWVIPLQNTTNQPALASLTNRALRERLYRASVGRGLSGATDNREIVTQLVKLRAERARLLGYPNHAAYVLEDESAGNPAAVADMIRQVAPAALKRAREEAADIQKVIDAQAAARGGPSFTLQPWDWSYYAEQVRKEHYDFDQAQVAPYFELERVLRDGLF